MGEPKCRKLCISRCKCSECINHTNELLVQEQERIVDDHKISIAHNVLTCTAKVDNRPRLRALLSKAMNMSHDIVPKLTLKLGCTSKLFIRYIAIHRLA